MSSVQTVKLSIIAEDRMTVPFNKMGVSVKGLSAKSAELGIGLKKVTDQLMKIGAYKKNQKEASKLKGELSATVKAVDELKEKMASTEKPTKALTNAFKRQQDEAAKLKERYIGVVNKGKEIRRELKGMQIDTAKLAEEERRLSYSKRDYQGKIGAQREKKRAKDARDRRWKETKESAAQLSMIGMGARDISQGIIGRLRDPMMFQIDFERQMSKVEARALFDVANMEERARKKKNLRDRARGLGASTSFTPIEVAQAMEKLGMAGGSYEDIMESTGGLLSIAKAGDIGLDQAAVLASDVMTQFNLPMRKLLHVGDVLATAGGKSTTDMMGIAEALSEVGSMAELAGTSLEDTNAMIALLAKQGIKRGKAGTALRAVIDRLIAPESGADKELLHIGFKATENGVLKSIPRMLKDIVDATSKFKKEDLIRFGKHVGGDTGSLALLGLLEGTKNGSLAEYIDLLNRVEGASNRVGGILEDNLGGRLKTLESAYQNLSVTIGDTLEPTMIKAVESATNFTRQLDALTGKYPGITKGVIGGAGLTAGAFGLGAGTLLMAGMAKYGWGGLKKLGDIMTFGKGAEKLVKIGLTGKRFATGGGVTLAGAAAGVLGASLINYIKNPSRGFVGEVLKTTEGLAEYAGLSEPVRYNKSLSLSSIADVLSADIMGSVVPKVGLGGADTDWIFKQAIEDITESKASEKRAREGGFGEIMSREAPVFNFQPQTTINMSTSNDEIRDELEAFMNEKFKEFHERILDRSRGRKID